MSSDATRGRTSYTSTPASFWSSRFNWSTHTSRGHNLGISVISVRDWVCKFLQLLDDGFWFQNLRRRGHIVIERGTMRTFMRSLLIQHSVNQKSVSSLRILLTLQKGGRIKTT